MKISTPFFTVNIPRPRGDQGNTEVEKNCEPFEKLEFIGGADIHFHFGVAEHRITLKGNEERLRNTQLDISDRTLKIVVPEQPSGSGSSNWPIEVHLYMNTLNSIKTTGHANLAAEKTVKGASLELSGEGHTTGNLTVELGELTTKLIGAGKLTLSGKTLKHLLGMEGAIQLRAFALSTQDTHASIEGVCKAELNASLAADLSADGMSSIRLTGKPAKLQERASSLSTIKLV
jgi:hypothetical protein